jgi:hypothetical protein
VARSRVALHRPASGEKPRDEDGEDDGQEPRRGADPTVDRPE